MANASDELCLNLQNCATELQNGATKLNLPPETFNILKDLRETIKDVIPTEIKDKDSGSSLYIYDIECASLARSIAEQKAQDITGILSLARMKRSGEIRVPRVFGLDKGGLKTGAFVGVCVLISDTVEVVLSPRETEKSPYTWMSDAITLFNENTTVWLPRSRANEKEEATSRCGGRTIYFYLGIPVERQH
ncbi:hypothetical protein CDV31_014574 [Fusarium ambrosium]|uniref:Uncharacterized protein n=1 Tax=Fusarium ambrosium TaxID=131363 RepID=A0A428SVH7_9HYPO|nr:hypothetical protein CDV31_014574 [Fusarium ambrosium]